MFDALQADLVVQRNTGSSPMLAWQQAAGVDGHYIQPDKRIQNAFIESFSGRRSDCSTIARAMADGSVVSDVVPRATMTLGLRSCSDGATRAEALIASSRRYPKPVSNCSSAERIAIGLNFIARSCG